jgi:O-antigen/teichoic acid export membrane protein
MRYFFGMPYSTKRHSKPLPVIFMVVAAIKVVLSYELIRQFGIYGAVAATLIAVGGEVVFLWAAMKSKFRYFFNPYKMIVGPLILGAVVLAVEPFWPASTRWIPHLGYVALTISMLTWLYRNEIKEMKPVNFFR